MKEKEKESQEINSFDEFNFEVSSTNNSSEFISEINEEMENELLDEKPKKRTIKIISEKDIQYKEAFPPNYSPNFKCILHFKDSDYKNRITLEAAKKPD